MKNTIEISDYYIITSARMQFTAENTVCLEMNRTMLMTMPRK